jgi:hypothetical protein
LLLAVALVLRASETRCDPPPLSSAGLPAPPASAAPPAASATPPTPGPLPAESPPSEADLSAARALFAEALRDENGGRFAAALEKFVRVQHVKDTAAVEYRLGSCYEGLHLRSSAYAAYRRAASLGDDDATMTEVVRGAQERLSILSLHVARLSLNLAPGAAPDASIRVDDATVAPSSLGEPIPLEPGSHVVVATAPNAREFRSDVTLPEGGEVSLTIPLPASPPDPPLAPAPTPVPLPEAKAAPSGLDRRTVGWIALGGGGALLAGAAAVLWLRHEDIASLGRSCPRGACPPGADEGALSSTRNRALAEGPAGVALGVAGVVAAGLGTYLLFTARPPPASGGIGGAPTPLVWRSGAGMAWAGAF